MTNLVLPQKQTKKQQAYERINVQIMDKTRLGFPGKINDKDEFIQTVIKRCNKVVFDKKFQCKWGWISNPITFLESLNDDDWEIEGVREFYKFYLSKKAERKKKRKRYYEKYIKPFNLPKKREAWEIGKEIERELNEYGKKWRISCWLDEIIFYSNLESDFHILIKIQIGPFTEFSELRGTKEEVIDFLKGLVKECLNYPEELQEMWEYEEECERLSEEYLKNNPHLVKKK
jgi:hypothetical protein